MTKTPLQFRHNGRDVAVFVDGGVNLLVALRELIGDMTPKFGCGQGGCGACTVLIDGELASVLPDAGGNRRTAARSKRSTDMKDGPNLHPLQRAFMEQFAAQCGYCTPGMLMAAKALLDRNPSPTRAEVVEAISGNICRCTGYEPIINAVLAAATGGRAPRLKGTTMLELRKDIFADERDDNLKEIGKGTQRQDMLGHVTGTSTYFDDHKLQGMLHLKVLRSPHAHARIRRIDTTEAERAPGVRRDHSRRRRAGQSQHAAQPDQFRQGRRAVARGRQGALQGRADRRHRRRQPARGL